MRKSNQAFAERVQQLLNKHGLSLRGQRVRTGVSHVTVQAMLQGVVPQMETVVAWAQGFGEDVNEWLILAGYEPIRPPTPAAAARQLLDLADRELEAGQEITREPEVGEFTLDGYAGRENFSPADLRRIEAAVRVLLKEIEVEKGLSDK